MGIFGVAIVGGAGVYAYKKIKKSRNQKRSAQQQQQQQPQDGYRDFDSYPTEKSRDLKLDAHEINANQSGDYYYHDNGNGYGYQQQYQHQPRALTFQPASDKFRGQQILIEPLNDTYDQSQQRFRVGSDNYGQQPTARQPLYSRSNHGQRYQSGFVEEIHDN